MAYLCTMTFEGNEGYPDYEETIEDYWDAKQFAAKHGVWGSSREGDGFTISVVRS